MPNANHWYGPILSCQVWSNPLKFANHRIACLQMIEAQIVRRGHDEITLLGQLFQHIPIGNVGSRSDQRTDQRTGAGSRPGGSTPW